MPGDRVTVPCVHEGPDRHIEATLSKLNRVPPALHRTLTGVVAALSLLTPGAPVSAQTTSPDPGVFVLNANEGHVLSGLVAGDEIRVEASSVILFGLIGTWSGVLVEDTTIGGLPCAGGAGVRFRSGAMTTFQLAAPVGTPFGTLPPGTWVEMNDGTSIRVEDALSDDVQLAFFAATLSSDTVWDGAQYDGGVELTFEPGGVVWLQHVRPLLAPVGGDMPCRYGREHDRALLHPDGSLARCALRTPFEIYGETVPVDSVVWFDSVGALTRVDLRNDWRIGEALYRAGEHVEFANGERVIVGGRIEFEDPMEFQRQSWRVDTGFYYGYPWGRVDGE